MRLVVTGGAGFVGRWLLKALPGDADVVVVDSLVPEVHGATAAFPDDVRGRAECIRCDVRDVDVWSAAAEGSDVIVHLASLTGTGQSMYQQRRFVEHNVTATSALCEVAAAMRPRPRRIILTSSRAVYGEGAFAKGSEIVYPAPRVPAVLAAGQWELKDPDGSPLTPLPVREEAPLRPISLYGMTKMWQEQLVDLCARACEIDFLILRPQNVYGPLQELSNPYTGILGAMTNGVVREGRFELFEDGEMTRDFVYVSDLARILVAGIQFDGRLARTLNVGSGHPVTLSTLLASVGEVAQRKPLVVKRGRYRLGDVRHACADMTACEKTFGPWHPVPLREGLAAYIRWFNGQPAPPAETLAKSLDEMSSRDLLMRSRQ